MGDQTLLPCPFCGGEGDFNNDGERWHQVICQSCGCRGCEYPDDKAKAAQFWNRRPAAWQPISTAPKDKMFIWVAPNGPDKWSLGLAYRNVSGGWSDAYGSDAPAKATLWAPLPEPPNPGKPR